MVCHRTRGPCTTVVRCTVHHRAGMVQSGHADSVNAQMEGGTRQARTFTKCGTRVRTLEVVWIASGRR